MFTKTQQATENVENVVSSVLEHGEKETPTKGIKKMNYEIHWQEHDLDDVMRYFAQGFKPEKGRVISYEFLIDTHRRLVVFKIITDPHHAETQRRD